MAQQCSVEGIDEYFGRFETAKDLVQLFNADVINIEGLLQAKKSERPISDKRVSDAKISYDVFSDERKQDKV